MEPEGKRKAEKRHQPAEREEDDKSAAHRSFLQSPFQSNQDETGPVNILTMHHNTDESRINLMNAALRQEQQRKEEKVPIDDTSVERHQNQKVRRLQAEDDVKVAAKPKSISLTPESTNRDNSEAIIAKLRSENETLRTQLEASMEEIYRLRQEMREQTQEALDRNFALQEMFRQYIHKQNQERERARFEQQQRASSSDISSTIASYLANLSNDEIISLLSKELHSSQANESIAREQQRSQRQQQEQHPNTTMGQLASSLYQSSRSASILASEGAPASRNQARQAHAQPSSAVNVPDDAIRSMMSSELRGGTSRQERAAQSNSTDHYRALMDRMASSLNQSTGSTNSFAHGRSSAIGREAPQAARNRNPSHLSSSSGGTHDDMYRAQLELQLLTEELKAMQRRVARRDG